MAGWEKIIAETVSDVEQQFDQLKYRLRERLGGRDPISILPYCGYGRPDRLYLKGRVLEDRGIAEASDNDTIWDNLVNMYKRFKSNEVPEARLAVRFQGQEQQVQCDKEGYFEVWVEPTRPLPANQIWAALELELLHPLREGYPPATAAGRVLVLPVEAQFGVISDIDDTVVQTDAANTLRMARTVFLSNARTRLPFPGVAAFYRALRYGAHKKSLNPLFFVSSSPWNMYDLFEQFFQIEGIPLGHVLFLRDWGISENEFLPFRHGEFKTKQVRQIMDFYPELPFILIGDSGQEDPEIYSEIVQEYRQRILAVYIRDVSPAQARDAVVQNLATQVRNARSSLILAESTLPMAEHARSKGWIAPETIGTVRQEMELDQAPASRLERLLGDEEEV